MEVGADFSDGFPGTSCAALTDMMGARLVGEELLSVSASALLRLGLLDGVL